MLPKPRIFSALFFGLGITLVVAALVAPRFITTDARLPLNVDTDTLTLTLSDPSARVLDNGQVSEVGVTKQIHQTIQEPTDINSVTIRVGLTVMRDGLQSDLERLREATVWTYRMNRLTGEFESPLTVSYQLAAPTNDVVAEGGWLKFPLDAQKTTYQIFDPTLRETRPAEFVEELTMSGRTVYHYRQVLEPTNVAELYDSVTSTTQLPLPDGTMVPAALFHSGQRDFFVDQRTGLIANVQENIKDYYAAAEGVTQEAFTFNGEATSSAVAGVLRLASTFPDPARVHEILKILAIVGGVIALLGFAGVFGLFGGKDTKRAERRKRAEEEAEARRKGFAEDVEREDVERAAEEKVRADQEKQRAASAKRMRTKSKRKRKKQADARPRHTKTVAELQAEYRRTSGRSVSVSRRKSEPEYEDDAE